MNLNPAPSFPSTRLRRNRRAPWLRAMLAETRLCAADLVWPVFVVEGSGQAVPVASMPGVERYSIDILVEKAREAQALGIPALALFPVTDPARKTPDGREATQADHLICRAVAALKAHVPQIGLICDVALDPYTTHGHDGVLDAHGTVDNDATIAVLCEQACALAHAGCDVVAPSDMMDGRIGAIRAALDAAGYQNTGILSYAAKYASAFYGPFREAVGSKSNLGGADKRGYQMDPANAAEALREIALDVAEGADMVMVKPGLPYLDIIAAARAQFPVPVLAYQVSGEYAMLKAAHQQGWLDFTTTMAESLLALKRAGARAIFTYAAREMAAALNSPQTPAK